jgi:hypothetical protein
MGPAQAVFGQHIGGILRRYCRQNSVAEPTNGETDQISARLWTILCSRGLPPPLRSGELGSPGEMTAAEVTPLVENVLGGGERRAALVDPVRQLIKACFHREFTVCRDSYREVSAEGVCRRQQFKKAVVRVSGSHCVDCPYWTSLGPQEHLQRLQAAWVDDVGDFTANCGVYLPEDFRALRVWLHDAARCGIVDV